MKYLLRSIFLIACFIVFSSHELFLKADSHYFQADQPAELHLFNGTFDKSENSIARDRIVNPKIIGPNYTFNPKDEDYYDKDNATYLKFKTGEAGTYVAGVSTLARNLEMTAEAFNEYLAHEGLESIITEREQEGSMTSGANEKYSKHVKSLLQIDEKRTGHYKTAMGYPIEFIPLSNPFDATAGDDISFQLLREGKPLPGQTVHYSTIIPGVDAHENENSTRTDKNGICTIRPKTAGKWYVATIHMTKSKEEDIDYESNWATLTFAIK